MTSATTPPGPPHPRSSPKPASFLASAPRSTVAGMASLSQLAGSAPLLANVEHWRLSTLYRYRPDSYSAIFAIAARACSRVIA
ncbi:hypothetical protein [Sorangium sp. So ce233]|uniref:hypothetical protein n=1 Tax=Sorangium sp. So ce233 TaxID=3133290 RepID=UPI003F6459CA